jgi:hypothetical protein
MNALHVVSEVPFARESIGRFGSITSFEQAGIGILSMSVQSMGFPLVTE